MAHTWLLEESTHVDDKIPHGERLREEQILKRGAALQDDNQRLPNLTEEDIDDLEDAPDAEVEETEETVVDQATAARTIAEESRRRSG